MSNTKHVVAWRIRAKANLLKAFKSQCAICKYDRYQGALEFHHLDPSQKDFTFSRISSKKWDLLIEEAKKCVCLCSVCHKEFHAGLFSLPDDIQKFDETLLTYQKHETLIGNKNGVKKN